MMPRAWREVPAAHLQPGDQLRRGHRVFECGRVAVNSDVVEVEAYAVSAGHVAAAAVTLSLPPDELVRAFT